MRKILFAFFLFPFTNTIAQKTNRHTPVLQKGLYVSFNPHSVLEPEQGAVGLGIGYRINKRFEIWLEGNYLYDGIIDEVDSKNLHGFRAIVSGKYFYNNKHSFFVGIDLRLKKYSFDDVNNFVNTQTNIPLDSFAYKASHTLIGGGVFWGKRFKLTANGKFEMEGNIGFGVKQRYISRKNIPAGYHKADYLYNRVSPLPDTDVEQALPYFPAIFRFIYHL